MRSSHLVLDQVEVAFDDERLVANAGWLLPATLAERLGIEQAADELIGPIRRAGAGGELNFRAGSGFWLGVLVGRGHRPAARPRRAVLDTVRQTNPVRRAIAAIGEAAWVDIAYPDPGVAPASETRLRSDRLIVRRVRHRTDQGQLFPTWDYHAFVTDRPGSPVELDADHRRRAVVELAVCDATGGSGRNHHPSGRCFANAAWLVLVCLAHNLLGWTATLGLAPATSRSSPRRWGAPSWPCPVGSAARRDGGGCCTCPPAGHGRTRSPWRWHGGAASPIPAALHPRSRRLTTT